MKRLFKYFLIILCFLVLFQNGVTAQDPIVIDFGHILGSGTMIHKASVMANDLIEKRSNGKLKLEIYPGGQLGTQFEEMENVKLGLQDMTCIQGIDRYCPTFSLFNIPFLFEDELHAYKAFYDSELAEEYIKKPLLQDHGIRIIGVLFKGTRMLTTNEDNPVKHPEDVKGLKLRCPDIPAWIKSWQSVGANVTAFPWDELYLALRQGVVDAQENPFSSIYDMKFYEVQKNIILTGHIVDWNFVMINEETFQSLDEELQGILLQAFEEACWYSYGAEKNLEGFYIDFFKEYGNNIIEVDKTEWIKAFSEASELFEGGPEMYKRIQSIR